jgi:hypothetical protein
MASSRNSSGQLLSTSADLVRTSASIPKEVYEKIEKRAHAERRSISSEIVVLLELALGMTGK